MLNLSAAMRFLSNKEQGQQKQEENRYHGCGREEGEGFGRLRGRGGKRRKTVQNKQKARSGQRAVQQLAEKVAPHPKAAPVADRQHLTVHRKTRPTHRKCGQRSGKIRRPECGRHRNAARQLEHAENGGADGFGKPQAVGKNGQCPAECRKKDHIGANGQHSRQRGSDGVGKELRAALLRDGNGGLCGACGGVILFRHPTEQNADEKRGEQRDREQGRAVAPVSVKRNADRIQQECRGRIGGSADDAFRFVAGQPSRIIGADRRPCAHRKAAEHSEQDGAATIWRQAEQPRKQTRDRAEQKPTDAA